MFLFAIGVLSTIVVEILLAYTLYIFINSNNKQACIGCRFYHVGTNTCIRETSGAKIIEKPVKNTCTKYERI